MPVPSMFERRRRWPTAIIHCVSIAVLWQNDVLVSRTCFGMDRSAIVHQGCFTPVHAVKHVVFSDKHVNRTRIPVWKISSALPVQTRVIVQRVCFTIKPVVNRSSCLTRLNRVLSPVNVWLVWHAGRWREDLSRRKPMLYSSNICTCPVSQSWNGNGCSDSSTHGEYCSSAQPCDTSGLLVCNGTSSRCTCTANSFWDGYICRPRVNNGSICNNTQQCYSGLICQNQYCQCPCINTDYWSSLTLTCQSCFGPDLFLFDGICYRIPVPANTTVNTYGSLSSSYPLSTIQYDYQLSYLFNQHIRVFNWTPIYFSTLNPLANYFQWSPDQTLIKPTYFCNDTVLFNSTGYALSFKLELNARCLRAWPISTTGQLISQLNTYVYHSR